MKNKVLYMILALLGFAVMGSGCTGADEYGSPWTEFNAKGKVTEKETGKPIEGIEVSVISVNYSDEEYQAAYGLTDSGGSYVMSTENLEKKNQQLKFIAKDIDGEANGGYFAPMVVLVDLKAKDFKDADGWFWGRAEKTVDFVMVRTELPEEE